MIRLAELSRSFTRGVATHLCGLALIGVFVARPTKAAVPPSMTAAKASCDTLAEQKIAASAIGLPSTGAAVTSAVLVPAAGEQVKNNQVVLAIPAYCKVLGIITPVDPKAPNINFQVNLPTSWNRKIMQLGGSGPNGVIPGALTNTMQFGPESIPPDAPYALSRGFVTYGSDSGHAMAGRGGRGGAAGPAGRGPEGGNPPAGGLDGAGAAPGGGRGPIFNTDWMANEEALTNFAYAQMKKTHDVTLVLVKTLYGVAPRHSYYMGSSQGGREALMVVQRFPQDYDGVFSQVPVFPFTYVDMLDEVLRTQTQVGDAWIPPAKVPVIGREVLRQCDALDGLADGLVSNYVECNNRFDPAISPHAFAAIRCPGGADTSDTCLSDAQIGAAQKFYGAKEIGFPLAHGWTSIPGWTTGSERLNNWKIVPAAPTQTTPIGGSLQTLVVRDPSATLLNFKVADYRTRLQALSALLDSSDPDLSAFHRRGGKLIMKVNTTDYTADSRWSYAYYQKVVELMGQTPVDQFLRFYVAVGLSHNRNVGTNSLTNEPVPSYVDFIGMLDDWVESGKTPPDAPILNAMDSTPPYKVNASFPLCRYPLYPRYKGKGDSNSAESFVCSKP